ncbi:phage tail length tape measure family protein [Agrobacterium sp. NPDC058088]|uniref:phage tail length tape measure family protein n=1 Tax=Agrobacterium sp. NPDC058088 TaxID=3346335 RepID=UPI0036D8061C
MTDIAALGISVDTRDLKSAKNEFVQFSNAAKVAERAASGLSNTSNKFSSAEIKAMAAAMGGVERASTAAGKALAAASLAAQRAGSVGASGVKALGQASGAARAQVQNLSYQMQDIITMLISGQAPFMLLAQQLPQVTQNGGQLNGVFAAMKQTISGLISPLGLATTAFVLIGSAAVSYFSEWMSSGVETDKTLKDHADMIERVAEEWGKAVPALQSYVAALKASKSNEELLTSTRSVADKQWELARQQVANLNVELSNTISLMNQAGTESTTVQAFHAAWEDVSVSVSKGEQNLSAVKQVQDALASAISQTGVPALVSFQAAFADLTQTMAGATRQAETYTQAALQALLVGKNGPQLGSLSPLFSENGKFYSGEDFTPRDAPTPSSRPLIELEGLPGASKTSSASKQKAYESATLSVKEQTRALQAQTQAQAALNPLVEDFGYSQARVKVATDLLLAAERDKRAITPQLIADINSIADAYANQVVEQNKVSEATKRAQEAVAFAKQTTAGFLNELRNGLRNGETFWESFGNAALSVLDRITDKLLNDVLDALFKVGGAGSGGGGGGFLSSLFSGLFGGGKSFFPTMPGAGLFESGGYTGDGAASKAAGIVHAGEYVFSAAATKRLGVGNLDRMHKGAKKGYQSGGYVTPFSGSTAQGTGQAGTQNVHVTVGVSVDQNGNLEAYVKDVARGEAVQVSTAVVKQNNKNQQNLYQNGERQAA